MWRSRTPSATCAMTDSWTVGARALTGLRNCRFLARLLASHGDATAVICGGWHRPENSFLVFYTRVSDSGFLLQSEQSAKAGMWAIVGAI